jgi:hypothetical protein
MTRWAREAGWCGKGGRRSQTLNDVSAEALAWGEWCEVGWFSRAGPGVLESTMAGI